MRLLGLLFIVLIAGSVRGQEAPKGVVEGTVVDEVTGEPVRRANVVLSGPAQGKAPESVLQQAQVDGRFRFEGLEPGNYSVMARKTGYMDEAGRGAAGPFPLSADEPKTGIRLKLMPQGIISGRVFDEDGDPAYAAHIQVFQRRRVAGKFRWLPLNGSSTNDRGEYRLVGLAAGEYLISANYTDHSSQMSAIMRPRPQVYATTYHPNGSDMGSAQVVTVLWGAETTGIDVRLRKEASFRVRVRVEGVSSEELPNVHVFMTRRDAMRGSSQRGFGTVRIEPGVFEIRGVQAGSWLVQAQTTQQGSEQRFGRTPIEVTDSDVTGVVVRLGAGLELTGRYVFEGDRPATVKWKDYHVTLYMEEGRYSGLQRTVSEEGVFSVPYDVPGKYRMNIQWPSDRGTYIASIQFGDEEYYGKELDLTNGAPGPLMIVYRRGMASVSGKVEGVSEGANGGLGMAVLVPVEAYLRRVEYMRAETLRPDGSFAFPQVRPGGYLVCHMVGGYQVLAEEGEPPKASMDAAVRLKVEPNGTHTVQLKAVRAAGQP